MDLAYWSELLLLSATRFKRDQISSWIRLWIWPQMRILSLLLKRFQREEVIQKRAGVNKGFD